MPPPLSRNHIDGFHNPRQAPQNFNPSSSNIHLSSQISWKYISPSPTGSIHHGSAIEVSPRTLPVSFQSFSFDENKSNTRTNLQRRSNPVLKIRKSTSTTNLSSPKSSISQESIKTHDIQSPHSHHQYQRLTSHDNDISMFGSICPSSVSSDLSTARSPEHLFTLGHSYNPNNMHFSPLSTSFAKEYKPQPIPLFNATGSDSGGFLGGLEGLPNYFDELNASEPRWSCDADSCCHHHHRESSNSIVLITCSDDGPPNSEHNSEISTSIAIEPMNATMLVPLIDRAEEMDDLLAHPSNKHWTKMVKSSVGSEKYQNWCVPLWTRTSREKMSDIIWLKRSRELLTKKCGGGFKDAKLWNDFCGMVGWEEEEGVLDAQGYNNQHKAWYRKNSSGSQESDSSGAMSSIMEEEGDSVVQDTGEP